MGSKKPLLALQDAVSNILKSIESGIIPAKEGSEMICRPDLVASRLPQTHLPQPLPRNIAGRN